MLLATSCVVAVGTLTPSSFSGTAIAPTTEASVERPKKVLRSIKPSVRASKVPLLSTSNALAKSDSGWFIIHSMYSCTSSAVRVASSAKAPSVAPSPSKPKR